MESLLSRVPLDAAFGSASLAASAVPIGIDGVIGAEWTGVTVRNVTHDAGASIGNIDTPDPTTAGTSCSIPIQAVVGRQSMVGRAFQRLLDAQVSALCATRSAPWRSPWDVAFGGNHGGNPELQLLSNFLTSIVKSGRFFQLNL
jgi:hypothetical protein